MIYYLQNDIILVRRRVAPTTLAIPNHSDEAYFATMRELFLVWQQAGVELQYTGLVLLTLMVLLLLLIEEWS